MVINALDREDLRTRVLDSRPFPNFVIDGFLDEDFAEQVYRDFPGYEEASALGRGFDAVNERRKIQITDTRVFPDSVKQLHHAMASREWLDTVSHALDIPGLVADPELKGGGMHVTGPCGRLDVHVDFNYVREWQLHRRANVLVFLNPDWETAWGGCLELWDEKVRNCHVSLAPIFNRCVVFETSDISFHGVTSVQCPPHVSRKSFAAYYYTAEPPPDWRGETHSTVFKARPDETCKRLVTMPAERIVRFARKNVRRMKGHLRR